MAGRHIKHRRIFVTVRSHVDPTVARPHRADGFTGSPDLYERFTSGLRSKLGDDEWLDTAEADAEHERILAVRTEAIRALHAGT